MKCLLQVWIVFIGAVLVVACGGGGGGGSPVPAAASTNTAATVTAPNTGTPVLYASSPTLLPIITRAQVGSGGAVTIDFQLTDDQYNAILDLTAADFRITLAKLQASPIGNLTGSWQSYLNRIEQPGVGPGLLPKLQATAESASAGTFTNNGDGTYRYVSAGGVVVTDAAILAQAATEGLDLSYARSRTHRVAMQFANGQVPANPVYDWVPASGKTTDLLHNNVVATDNCNSCHSNLAIHGGGRVEMQYCVTCHNPGSTDANSGNTVDFKVMVHKLHRGANLPSVVAGGSYGIYGYGNRLHDYSALQFPRDIRDCHVCHAGSATGTTDQTLTEQGDNWNEYATRAACGSCHDDLDFTLHYGGQNDDNNCMSCHSVSGVAGSIASRHIDPIRAARGHFEGRILSILNTAPGEFPLVDFAIVDPLQNNAAYDILNDAPFTQSGASLSLKLAWSTADYHNTGNGGSNANSVSVNVLSSALANGDGTFRVSFTTALPDGSVAPNVPAVGSGAVVLEGRMAVDLGTPATPDVQRIPLTNVVEYFSITDSRAAARREVVSIAQCLACHGSLSLHGGNRTDNIESCVSCHNPRNTDLSRRGAASPPPTDGKAEQSVDFKVLIHGIHAAGMVENPLQVVGYGGTVHVFDTSTVHFPGELKNCTACHVNDSYQLPLAGSVLATTIASGADVSDPADDTVVSPQAAICSSCHDDTVSKAHMESNGASFATSQGDVDTGVVLEQCEICHGAGRTYSVESAHGL